MLSILDLCFRLPLSFSIEWLREFLGVAKSSRSEEYDCAVHLGGQKASRARDNRRHTTEWKGEEEEKESGREKLRLSYSKGVL